jgi:hypothetical protein
MRPKKATPGSKSKQASLMSFFENSAKKKDLRTQDENVALSSASSSTSTPVRTSPRRLHQQESKYPLDSTVVKKASFKNGYFSSILVHSFNYLMIF